METLIEERGLLLPSLGTTLAVTLAALVLAVIGGVLLAIVLTQSRIIEYSIFPIAVVVQVTPIVAVFPLINIYIDNLLAKILLCAWIIAFFPILSNTTLGLMSADRNLSDLYRLYGASRWQTLRHLSFRPPSPTSSAACASPAGSRSSARWWRSSSPARPASARGSRRASSRPATSSRSRVSSRRSD